MAKTGYEEAEKSIREALATESTRLDLRNLGLSELPESLWNLSSLQELYLGGNQLSELPELLGNLSSLQGLQVDDNQLSELPESLGNLSRLLYLVLSGNQLSELPESLGNLSNLKTLRVDDNQLSQLPESLGNLRSLQQLFLENNQLSEVPNWLGDLRRLEDLFLNGNQLRELPEWLGNLRDLQRLFIGGNQLSELPEWLGKLRSLRELDLHANQLRELPASLGNLNRLHDLFLGDNQLSELPASLGNLSSLIRLHLDNNQLSTDVNQAAEKGTQHVLELLRERQKGTRQRFEAKLLVLGDGNEGKTCVSRALRDQEFRKQVTTRGVDVSEWLFGHPYHADQQIKLNIWDFEGQEINHQTHQFFLTTDAIYLLVFKCREQFDMSRAEYWLDTIEARAPGVKVAIVLTECEDRTPYVPQDQLEAEYKGTLLAGQWLFPVGCADNSGVRELQAAVQQWAADLPHMGSEWPKTYQRAEELVEQQEMNHITRHELYELFEQAEINASGYETAVAALATLGILTEFPKYTNLRDFVVLKPQWLTKAISHVLENKELARRKGQISFDEMNAIWYEQSCDGMFNTFHNCMKEFELCYDIENQQRGCLIPLRFAYQQPHIPWTNNPHAKTRRVQYKLNKRTPMGLMSRFIVKTHHLIAKEDDAPLGVYWHNGVFLRTGEGANRSEALCVFDPQERTLSIEVRAPFPQSMIEQTHAFAYAVFSFFEGLTPERSFGCIQVDEDSQEEIQCDGFHTERRIYQNLNRDRDEFDCEFNNHDVSPRLLISGIGSFGHNLNLRNTLREELDKEPKWAGAMVRDLNGLVKWAGKNATLLKDLREQQQELSAAQSQELELRLREYIGFVSDMLDNRHLTAAPTIFSLTTKDSSRWNVNNLVKHTYVLTPYCECDGNMHPHEPGHVTFKQNKEWWEQAAPWIARGTQVLQVGLQLAFVGMPLSMGSNYDIIKNEVSFMKTLAGHLKLEHKECGSP